MGHTWEPLAARLAAASHYNHVSGMPDKEQVVEHLCTSGKPEVRIGAAEHHHSDHSFHRNTAIPLLHVML